jgi:hypothetical protein
MPNIYPYPTREHRELPTCTSEVIDEELRLYEAGPSFRGGILALSRIYGSTSLFTGLKKYAALMNLATAISGSAEAFSPNGINMDFYAGEILAAHCLVRPEPLQTRQYLYGRDILPEYAPPANGYYDENGDAHAFVVDHKLLLGDAEDLIKFRQSGWQKTFAEMPEPLQEKAIEASIKAYSDDRNASAHENDFLIGFSNASKHIGILIVASHS